MNSRHGELTDVDAVHVGELLHIEEGRRPLDVFNAEGVDQRRQRDDLVLPGAPTQKGQVVAEGRREVTLLAVHLDRHRITSLGELLALLVDQKREMGECRQGKSEKVASFRACHNMICLGVLGRCSSPRKTWVIAMVRSSTTLASANSGLPFPLTT